MCTCIDIIFPYIISMVHVLIDTEYYTFVARYLFVLNNDLCNDL